MKLNIDTDAARTAHADELNSKASAFVVELEDRLDGMTATEQSQLLDRLTAVVSNKDSASAFAAGTYAQDSSGNPARALGGSSSVADENAALQVIMASSNVPPGVKAAIVRIITPSDPAHIQVEDDGTPKALRAAARERDSAKAERDTARTELADERDPAKANSLKAKLDAAITAAATPADMVAKATIKPLAEAAKAAADAIKPSLNGGAALKADAQAKAKAVVDAVS